MSMIMADGALIAVRGAKSPVWRAVTSPVWFQKSIRLMRKTTKLFIK